MKTQNYIKDLLLQHRKLTEKAVKCFMAGNLPMEEKNWQQVYIIEQQIIDAFAEGAAAIADKRKTDADLYL